MATATRASLACEAPTGRWPFRVGFLLVVLGVVIYGVRIALKQLGVPWSMPILATAGVGLILYSLKARAGVLRIVALVLCTLLAGLEWYFLLSFSLVPAYSGPVREGQKLPAFQTTLSDGRPFTEMDLENGMPTLLVIFRGRW